MHVGEGLINYADLISNGLGYNVDSFAVEIPFEMSSRCFDVTPTANI